MQPPLRLSKCAKVLPLEAAAKVLPGSRDCGIVILSQRKQTNR